MGVLLLMSMGLGAYVILRSILPLQVAWFVKIGLAFLVCLGVFKFQILAFWGGPMFFAPDLPRWILLSSAWLHIALFIFFFLLLGADLLRVLVGMLAFIRAKKWNIGGHQRNNQINLMLLILAMGLTTFGIYKAAEFPSVREQEITINQLPTEAQGLRIVVLADLHVDRFAPKGRMAEIVAKTNELNADLVVIVGDFVDGQVVQFGEEFEALRSLKSKYGVFGVPGNHEYYSGYEEWMTYFEQVGVKMLVNDSIELPNHVLLVGVADPTAYRSGKEPPNLKKAIGKHVEIQPKILLAHQPRLVPEAKKEGIALQISGHTHGGMIRGFDQIVARANEGFVSGLYAIDDFQLYVSNGTSLWSGFPVRLGRPAEITLLILNRK